MNIGVIGGGQLGRMLALAGYPLGLRFLFLDPAPDACAGEVGEHLQAPYDDTDALQQLAGRSDIVTFEFENVPWGVIEFLESEVPAYPPPRALETSQDRLYEKSLFRELGIPTPVFARIDSRAELDAALDRLGYPCVLKTRRLGYDGKGQAVLRDMDDVDAAWETLGGVPLILEQFIEFQREVSMIAVRSRTGETAFYPMVENHHREGILRCSLTCNDQSLQEQAESLAGRLLDKLDYVGVLALELFQIDDVLMANEMAPRVHNSGHWSIEGAHTSQFENHLRAILGLPLGSTAPVGCSAMVNFIGAIPEAGDVLAIPNACFHSYSKDPKPGRKVGHATIAGATPEQVEDGLNRLLTLAGEPTD